MDEEIIRQCINSRTPIPEKILNAPTLNLGLELFYKAFLDLNTCRGSSSMAEGAISWLSMKQYCGYNEIYGEQEVLLIFYVSKMDYAYLKLKANKR